MERIEDRELDELGEVNPEPASYQVWVLGYDANECITDFEFLVHEFKDPDTAISYAKNYIDEEKYKDLEHPSEVVYAEVLVETVVNNGDYDENVGTLFYGTVMF